jgi:hypothetical protein
MKLLVQLSQVSDLYAFGMIGLDQEDTAFSQVALNMAAYTHQQEPSFPLPGRPSSPNRCGIESSGA